MTGSLLTLMSGASMACCWMLALIFYKFWIKGSDRLFAFFALSFTLMGTERLILALVDAKNEYQPAFYLFRLIAFLIIIAAVVDKNRSSA